MQKDNKINLLKLVKSFGYSEKDGFKKIGIVLDSLASGQIPYAIIKELNSFIENNPWISISIFFIEDSIPCIDPTFARFNIKDAMSYNGTLVATSYNSASYIKNCSRAKKMFYIYDLTFINNKDENNVLNDDKIIKFTRSKDYHNLLVSKGYKISDRIVEYFDINKIMEIINNA